MATNNFLDIFMSSPSMILNTFVVILLWPLTLISFLKLKNNNNKLNKVALFILSSLCLLNLALGVWGYNLIINLTQQGLNTLEEQYRAEALSLAKEDGLRSLYFSIFTTAPTLLFFLFYGFKKNTKNSF